MCLTEIVKILMLINGNIKIFKLKVLEIFVFFFINLIK